MKYCSECGKKLVIVHAYGVKKYDTETGEPIYKKISIYQCPDYQSGFSDREWSYHDQHITEEVVDNIDNLPHRGLLRSYG